MDTPSDSVVIRVLGPLDVECCGAAVTIASPMQRRVLAALAMADGATVSTDALVAALWGEDPPPSARNSLQSHVARLREAIGPGHGIATRPPGYALDTTTVAVDARDFQDRVAAARARVVDDPAGAADDLRTALAAWRGDAYGEFAADLAREEATRLQELHAEAMELLVGALLRTDPAAAVDAARRLLGAHPLRESAALLAARSLAAAGRVPEALEVLHDHRERLAEQLGLDPSPAVAALAEELLREPSPSHPVAPRPPRTGAIPPPRPAHRAGRRHATSRE